MVKRPSAQRFVNGRPDGRPTADGAGADVFDPEELTDRDRFAGTGRRPVPTAARRPTARAEGPPAAPSPPPRPPPPGRRTPRPSLLTASPFLSAPRRARRVPAPAPRACAPLSAAAKHRDCFRRAASGAHPGQSERAGPRSRRRRRAAHGTFRPGESDAPREIADGGNRRSGGRGSARARRTRAAPRGPVGRRRTANGGRARTRLSGHGVAQQGAR